VSDGVSVVDAIVAIAALVLRADPSSQLAELTILSGGSFGDDWEVYITPLGAAQESYVVTAAGTETPAEFAALMAIQINAGTNFEAVQKAAPDDATLEIRGVVDGVSRPAPWVIEGGSTGDGTGTITREASWVRWSLWGLLSGRTDWVVIDGGATHEAIGNQAKRVNCAGLDRLYVEILGGNGLVTPVIGPGGDES